MIDLVLDHARLEPGGLDDDLLAVLVQRAYADVHRPLDVDEHRRQAQAALLGDLLLLAAPLDLGVDQRGDRRLLLHAVDEHAMQHADLGCRQSDAERVVHQLAHPCDLLAKRVVDPLDRPRLRLQHRIAELAHVRERRRPPRRDLGIELGLGVLLGLLLELFELL